MSIEAIQALVKSDMGLSPESVGADAIARAVLRRMEAAGVADAGEYLALVQRSAAERQCLVNDLTVPETWFFRDREPFNTLASFVGKRRLRGDNRSVRILSVPCSTGEEPYSIAMALYDAGLSLADFTIDAVDISTRVLEKAQAGVYGSNSFRGKEVAFRDRYFEQQGDDYRIRAELAAAVNFTLGNVVSPGFMAGQGPYDVVFCRNLLIYFDYDTKCAVLKRLHGMMSEGGLLVLGHAETGRMPQGLFDVLKMPGAFAYLKHDAAAHQVLAAPVVKRAASPTGRAQRARPAQTARVSAASAQAVHEAVAAPPVVDGQHALHARVESIQALADAGRLEEALTECDRLIGEVPDLAQGYYLRGLALLALDLDDDAMVSFRKAVYLDPRHYQSLIHLSVLAEEQGDLRGAENFRNRAERAKVEGHVDAL